MKISPKAVDVLARLRAFHEYKDPDGFGVVYLDNAKPVDLNPHQYAGYLAALEAEGLYKPVDGFAWGKVLL